MAFRCSSVTPASGTVSYTGFGFTPRGVIFRIDKKGTGGDAASHMSIGTFDGTRQSVGSTFSDASGSKTERFTTKCLSHQERVSGTIQEVLSGTCTLDADGITLNMSLVNANYQVTYMAFD